ncbi:hypothetical protein HK102_008221 [Quaeritorhiza haematococci]|nr:hypothetical protein HK102_008221 [Quaeritorhiza haematococci]
MAYVGSKISLVSKSDIRYVGILHSINQQESTVALEQVRSYGTEGRRGNPTEEIPPSEQLFDYIVFRGADIKDLHVVTAPNPPVPSPPQIPNDPAILGTQAPRPPGFQSFQQPGVPMLGQSGPSFPGMLPPGMNPYLLQQASMGFPPQQQPPFWPPPQQGFPGQPPQQPQQQPPQPIGTLAPPQKEETTSAPATDPVDALPMNNLKITDHPAAVTEKPAAASSEAPKAPSAAKDKKSEDATQTSASSSAAPKSTGPSTSSSKVPSQRPQPEQQQQQQQQGVNKSVRPEIAGGKDAVKEDGHVQSVNHDGGEHERRFDHQRRHHHQGYGRGGHYNNTDPNRLPGTGAHLLMHNNRRGGRGGGGGRGGRHHNHPNGMGGGRTNTRVIPVPDSDFDFESANAKFNKTELVKEVSEKVTHEGHVEGTNGVEAAPEDVKSPTSAVEDDAENENGVDDETFYDKGSSFFDNISCETKDRASGERINRRDRQYQERRLNLETFGQTGLDNRSGYRRNMRGRGGRGGGYRGRPNNRGGYNNYYHNQGYSNQNQGYSSQNQGYSNQNQQQYGQRQNA